MGGKIYSQSNTIRRIRESELGFKKAIGDCDPELFEYYLKRLEKLYKRRMDYRETIINIEKERSYGTSKNK